MKMLIELDSDYERTIISRNSLSKNEIQAFSILLNSVAEGRNFLKASYNFFDFLNFKYISYFSYYVKNYLKNVINSYTTMMSDVNGVDAVLMISNQSLFDNLSLNCSCRININDLPKYLFGSLYCENISDCDFFELLYLRLCSTKLNIFLDKQTFGGGSAKGVVGSLLNNKEKVFFCIADSDKKYKTAPLGSTAASLLELYKTHNHCFSALYILGVHEKENLIPCSLLSTMDCFDEEQKKFTHIVSTLNDETKEYIDLKDGISKKCRKEMRDNNDIKLICFPIMEKMKRLKMYHSKKEDKILVRGLGNNGAEKAINCIESFDVYYELLTKNQKCDLDVIFGQIKRFGLAYCLSYS